MKANCRIYISTSHDPWLNLAMEDWLLHDLTDFGQALFLWRNEPTVVIGRSQNPWVECRLEKMQQQQVKLARRQSGGGAVYHDLGNTNFTFLSTKKQYDKKRNEQIILDALAQVGVKAHGHGRNDLVITVPDNGVRKISGSAYKEKADRAFHHGTLLLNANLTALQTYLNPDQKKIEAKGVKSVRARVMNCSEVVPNIEHDAMIAAIIASFRQCYHADVEPEIITQSMMSTLPGLEARYQQMCSEAWLYGQTLPFSHQLGDRFAWGGIDIRLQVDNANISTVQIFSDCLYPEIILQLEQRLNGIAYAKDSILTCLQQIKMPDPQMLADLTQLVQQELDA